MGKLTEKPSIQPPAKPAAKSQANAPAAPPAKTAGEARAGALDVLETIDAGAYANLALDAYLEGQGRLLSARDRAFLTELVLGTVKRRLTLDWIIDRLLARPRELQTGPRNLLRLGLYQLCFLKGVPERAAVFETVQLAKTRYHAGVAALANGVLRRWLREAGAASWPDPKTAPADYLAVRHSHPPWLVEIWLQRYGFEDTEAFCRFNNEAPPVWLRTNTLKLAPSELAELLAREGCRTERGRYAPEALALLEGPGLRRLRSFRDGLFAVQDESSMLAAHALAPQPGQRVLDTCAAPGGKTGHLAQLMGDQGSVAAWDIHPHRVRLIQENQKRLGIRCIEARIRDAGAGETGEDGGARYDRILVDAPCSGLGVLRRRADARWNKRPSDAPRLAELQKSILHQALGLLAPGGRLLYCTCTTEPAENRLLAAEVLAAHPDCKKGRLALPLLDEENRDLLPDPAGDWDWQALPFRHGLEGFYMALMEKEGGPRG